MTDAKTLRAVATARPWRECGHERGGCQCGIGWSTPLDVPVFTTDTDSEEEGFTSTTARKIADAALIVYAVNHIEARETELAEAMAYAYECGLRDEVDNWNASPERLAEIGRNLAAAFLSRTDTQEEKK